MTFAIQANRQIPGAGTLAGELYNRKSFLSDTGESKTEYLNRGIKPQGFKAGGIKLSGLVDTPIMRIDLA